MLKNAIGTKKRIYFLDAFRGFLLLNMICYHTLWNLQNVYSVVQNFTDSSWGFLYQQFICCSFIFLSGFCFKMGRSRLLGGILVLLGALVVRLVTQVFSPITPIKFGVLFAIGSSTIICYSFDLIFGKLRFSRRANLVLFLLFMALFALVRFVPEGYFGVYGLGGRIDASLYSSNFGVPFGFPTSSFYSTDYFSLIPWLFLFVAGVFAFGAVDVKSIAPRRSIRVKPLEFLGRYSLIVYLLH